MMFIPFVVNAETCDIDKMSIKSITIEDKSDNVEELKDLIIQELVNQKTEETETIENSGLRKY